MYVLGGWTAQVPVANVTLPVAVPFKKVVPGLLDPGGAEPAVACAGADILISVSERISSTLILLANGIAIPALSVAPIAIFAVPELTSTTSLPAVNPAFTSTQSQLRIASLANLRE